MYPLWDRRTGHSLRPAIAGIDQDHEKDLLTRLNVYAVEWLHSILQIAPTVQRDESVPTDKKASASVRLGLLGRQCCNSIFLQNELQRCVFTEHSVLSAIQLSRAE